MDDQFAFRNTDKFDLLEAYGSGRIPLGSALTLKAGKFVTLLGYEVIESPNNLNFSRGYLFTLSTPFTTTGALASYTFTDWFSATAGFILGWDDSQNVNDPFSYAGQFAFTPLKDFTANLNWIAAVRRRPARPALLRQQPHPLRARLRLRLHRLQEHDPGLERRLRARGQRRLPAQPQHPTEHRRDVVGLGPLRGVRLDRKIRTAVRREYFPDANGARTGTGVALDLWSTTATFQYKIWKGLVGRLEYRHDHSNDKEFRIRYSRPDITSQGRLPRSKSLDTISMSLYYSFL